MANVDTAFWGGGILTGDQTRLAEDPRLRGREAQGREVTATGRDLPYQENVEEQESAGRLCISR